MVRSSMINFVDGFLTIKEDLSNCTLTVILFLERGVEIRTLQHEKESSNGNQYKNSAKESSKRIQK